MAAGKSYYCDNNVITEDNASVYGDGNAITGNNTHVYGDNNIVTGDSVDLYGDKNTVTGQRVAVYGDHNMIIGNTRFLSGNGNTVSSADGSVSVRARVVESPRSAEWASARDAVRVQRERIQELAGTAVVGGMSGSGNVASGSGNVQVVGPAWRGATGRDVMQSVLNNVTAQSEEQLRATQRQQNAQRQRQANRRRNNRNDTDSLGQMFMSIFGNVNTGASASSSGGVRKRPIVRRLGRGTIYIQRRDGGMSSSVSLGGNGMNVAGVQFPPGTRTGGVSSTQEGSTVSGLDESVIDKLVREYPDEDEAPSPLPDKLEDVLERLSDKDKPCDDTDDDERQCSICCERIRCVALDPCGDVPACVACTKKLVKDNKIECPLCRAECKKVAFARV